MKSSSQVALHQSSESEPNDLTAKFSLHPVSRLDLVYRLEGDRVEKKRISSVLKRSNSTSEYSSGLRPHS